LKALKNIGFNGTTTLEIAGAENVKISTRQLRGWQAKNEICYTRVYNEKHQRH